MSFGETALYINSSRTLTVKAKSDDVELLALGRDSLQQILGTKVEIAIFQNYQRWALERNKVLKNLNDIDKEKILEKFEQKNFSKNQVILKQGTCINKLVVCVQGSMYYENSGDKKIFAQGEVFGGDYLYPKLRDKEPLKGNLIMQKDGVISVLPFKALVTILGMSVAEAIDKNIRHQKKENKLANIAASKRSRRVKKYYFSNNFFKGNQTKLEIKKLFNHSKTGRWSIWKRSSCKGS